MKAAAIILAAGESRRMGRPKATLPFRGGTFLSVLAETLGLFCSTVIAVFGASADALTAAAPAGLKTVANRKWEQGMLTSLQAGLKAVPKSCDAVLFTLVDHPAVQPSTLAALLQTTEPIAIPRNAGKRGHPVLLTRPLFEEFLREPATSQVRDLINRHADKIEYVEVSDTAIFDDIDDPALYQQLLARESAL